MRAALLMVDDLALLLHDRIAEAIGVDPLSPQGMERWATEALAVYGYGLLGPA